MKKKQSKTVPDKSLSLPARLSLTLASALLCTASFPNIDLWPLAWFSLMPLVYVLAFTRGIGSFGVGLLFGATHMMSLAYWIFNALYFHTGVGFCVSLLFLLLVIGLCMGCYYGLFALAAARILKSRHTVTTQALSIAAAWVTVEFLRAHLFSGAPWDLFGHSQYRWLGLLQIADMTGVYGISFLLVFTNCCLVQACRAFPDTRTAAAKVLPAAGLLACVLAYGAVRMQQFPAAGSEAREHTTAIIQLSISQDDRWKQALQEQHLARYLELSEAALAKGATLLVWPENATQTYFQEHISVTLLRLLSRHTGELVIGAPRYTGAPGGYTFYNSAFLMNGGGIVQVYDKMHLLPFGEYFPLGFIDILRLTYSGPRQYAPGESCTVFTTGQGKLGPLICFEIAFPGIVRGFVRQGAEILVNISNDAWFGRTSAHYQHFSMAVFRAVEFRRPVLRSANTGISGHIDAAGRILSRIEPFQEGVSMCSPAAGRTQTAYCRFGDVFAWLCAALAAAAFMQRKR